MPTLAVQAIRRMRGGAQSQLMLGADNRLWVVKFQNNPQGMRILANELLATRIAAAAGLSVPDTGVIELTPWLAANSRGLTVDRGRGLQERVLPGLHFGSAFVGGLMPGQVVDLLPERDLGEVRNLSEFAGMLALDKWTGNCNGRQAVFERRARERRYRALFIDQGFCFNAGEWTFPDSPVRGIYSRDSVYDRITGWHSFEPWLSRLESFSPDALWAIGEAVPPEWYGGNLHTLEQLFETLLLRRTHIRTLLLAVRASTRQPFPNWTSSDPVSVPTDFAPSTPASRFVTGPDSAL